MAALGCNRGISTMSHDSKVVALRPDLPIQDDNKVVWLRPPLRTEDCIELMELALAFGWQPFTWVDYNHVEAVPLELALQRVKAVLMTDDVKVRDYRLWEGLVPGYPVVGIDSFGLRGIMIEHCLELWERGELIKMLDDLIRAERHRCEG
jgi:hypothetical protein